MMNFRKFSLFALVVSVIASAPFVAPSAIISNAQEDHAHLMVSSVLIHDLESEVIQRENREISYWDKLSSNLRRELELRRKDEVVRIVIRLEPADLRGIEEASVVSALKAHADRTQKRALELLRGQGAKVLNRFWIANAILAEARVSTAYELTFLPTVWRIHEDFELTTPKPPRGFHSLQFGTLQASVTWGLDMINAENAWGLGYDGTGIRVAVLDTGVDITHPDLIGKMWTDNPADPTYPGGWAEFDSAGNIVVGSTPHDTAAHGTHCSGTVLGENASGTWIGVAPSAILMHGLVIPGGGGTFAQVAAGMQWAISPTDQYGNPASQRADVVSMSLVAGGYWDEMIEPVRNIKAAGAVPVASIGNAGEGTSGSPGNVYETFAIGATDNTDAVAYFSSGETVYLTDWTAPRRIGRANGSCLTLAPPA